MTTPPPRFLLDGMLGKLATWLRILGYDARYRRNVDDEDLAREVARTGRVLVTRDVDLAQRPPTDARTLLVRSRDPRQQVTEVVDGASLGIDEDRILTRCSRCNARLNEVGLRDVQEDVPPNVADAHQAFQRCPVCEKVYWEGTHVDGIRELVRELRAHVREGRDDR